MTIRLKPEILVDVKALARALYEEGRSVKDIADRVGKGKSSVYRWITRTVDDERRGTLPPPWLFVPRWPAGPFTPSTTCECKAKPIPRGSMFWCPVCEATGWDGHPELRRPKIVPREKKKAAAGTMRVRWTVLAKADALTLKDASKKLSRRERRSLAFGRVEAATARALYARLAGTDRPDQLERDGERLLHIYSASSTIHRTTADPQEA